MQIIKAANESRNVPPHDPEATSAQEAYKFEGVCPPFLWEQLPTQTLVQAASDSLVESAMKMEKVKLFYGWLWVNTYLSELSAFVCSK